MVEPGQEVTLIAVVALDQEEIVGQELVLEGMEILAVVLDLEENEGQEPGQEGTEIVAAVVLDQDHTVKEIGVQAVLDMDADFFLYMYRFSKK